MLSFSYVVCFIVILVVHFFLTISFIFVDQPRKRKSSRKRKAPKNVHLDSDLDSDISEGPRSGQRSGKQKKICQTTKKKQKKIPDNDGRRIGMYTVFEGKKSAKFGGKDLVMAIERNKSGKIHRYQTGSIVKHTALPSKCMWIVAVGTGIRKRGAKSSLEVTLALRFPGSQHTKNVFLWRGAGPWLVSGTVSQRQLQLLKGDVKALLEDRIQYRYVSLKEFQTYLAKVGQPSSSSADGIEFQAANSELHTSIFGLITVLKEAEQQRQHHQEMQRQEEVKRQKAEAARLAQWKQDFQRQQRLHQQALAKERSQDKKDMKEMLSFVVGEISKANTEANQKLVADLAAQNQSFVGNLTAGLGKAILDGFVMVQSSNHGFRPPSNSLSPGTPTQNPISLLPDNRQLLDILSQQQANQSLLLQAHMSPSPSRSSSSRTKSMTP